MVNKDLLQYSRELRKNMTKEERHLWYDYLRSCKGRFRRQKVVGNYIVDFYSVSAKLIIELDGSQHFEDKGKKYDKARTEYLEGLGFEVVRIPNNEVNNNFYEVCTFLDNLVNEKLK